MWTSDGAGSKLFGSSHDWTSNAGAGVRVHANSMFLGLGDQLLTVPQPSGLYPKSLVADVSPISVRGGEERSNCLLWRIAEDIEYLI